MFIAPKIIMYFYDFVLFLVEEFLKTKITSKCVFKYVLNLRKIFFLYLLVYGSTKRINFVLNMFLARNTYSIHNFKKI